MTVKAGNRKVDNKRIEKAMDSEVNAINKKRNRG